MPSGRAAMLARPRRRGKPTAGSCNALEACLYGIAGSNTAARKSGFRPLCGAAASCTRSDEQSRPPDTCGVAATFLKSREMHRFHAHARVEAEVLSCRNFRQPHTARPRAPRWRILPIISAISSCPPLHTEEKGWLPPSERSGSGFPCMCARC